MAGAFSIKIEGLEKLQADLSEKAKSIVKEIDAEIGFACDEAVGFMQTDAPADQGRLRQSISKAKIGELNYEIVAQADYAAYLEFGTRAKVVIPPGLEAVAEQYKGSGGGSILGAKEAIFNWCKRKGIDPKAWYPIYISLMAKGVSPHPFFFNNFERVKEPLLKNIQNIKSLEGF